MRTLLTIQQLKEWKQLPEPTDTRRDNVVQQCIREAEEVDLAQLTGNALYTAIVAAPEQFADLLEPHIFEYCGNTYSHPGLLKVIAGYAYARYLEGDNVRATAFGVRTQNSDQSAAVEMKEIRRRADNSRATAATMFNDIVRFIDISEKYCRYRRIAKGDRNFFSIERMHDPLKGGGGWWR